MSVLKLFLLCCVWLLPASGARAQFGSFFIKSPPFVSISQSGNFNGSNARLTITPAVASRTTFTYSTWMRPTSVTGGRMLLNSGSDASHQSQVQMGSGCTCLTFSHQEGSVSYSHQTIIPTLNQWIHFVVAVDTTQSALADRVRIWVDGVPKAITNGSDGGIPQGTNLYFGRNALHSFGAKWDGNFFYSGQLADTYYINGLALGPEAFIRPVGNSIKSINYTGPQASSIYLKYVSGALGVNSFTGGAGNLTNSNVATSAVLPY